MNGIKPFPSSSQVIMGIFVVFLFSPCRARWPVGNGRGKWEWKRWKGEEKSGHCLRASFSMHSPDRAWCWQHNSRATWQLIGGKKRQNGDVFVGRICMPMSFSLDWLKVSLFLSLFLSQSLTLFSLPAFSHSFPPVANLVPRDLRMLSFKNLVF